MAATRLPVAFKCTEGRIVEFKRSTHAHGWETAGRGYWPATLSERKMHVQMTQPTAQIDAFALNLEPRVEGGLYVRRAEVSGFFWGSAHRNLIAPMTNVVLDASQCRNEWVGEKGDVERDNGKNNNGWALDITVGDPPAWWDHNGRSFAVRIWPKREDRLRLDFRFAEGVPDLNLEIDTQE